MIRKKTRVLVILVFFIKDKISVQEYEDPFKRK